MLRAVAASRMTAERFKSGVPGLCDYARNDEVEAPASYRTYAGETGRPAALERNVGALRALASLPPLLGMRLSEETQHRLEALAKARDRTPHYLMKAAVERFLDVEEALEAERQLVKDRWQKYELTGETLDHADVKAWAASLGDTSADLS